MLDVLGQVQAAWVDVLAAEAAIPVADERLAVAQRLEREVARRVGRALDPLFAGERAHTAVAQARIARDQAVGATNNQGQQVDICKQGPNVRAQSSYLATTNWKLDKRGVHVRPPGLAAA